MTVCFDTNVLLDALLDRSHAEEALFLLNQAREGELAGVARFLRPHRFCVRART